MRDCDTELPLTPPPSSANQVEENVANHEHGRLVLLPDAIERPEELVLQGSLDDGVQLGHVGRHHIHQPAVELAALLVQHQKICVAVQLLKAQLRLVLLLVGVGVGGGPSSISRFTPAAAA